MSEKHRAHPRYALEVDAEVAVDGGFIPVRTKDLSRGGMCFVAGAPLPVSRDVAMSMSLVFDEKTFSEPLKLRARVVWCTGLADDRWQVGVGFLGLTMDQRSYLEMFLRYLKEGLARQARERGDSGPTDDEESFFG